MTRAVFISLQKKMYQHWCLSVFKNISRLGRISHLWLFIRKGFKVVRCRHSKEIDCCLYSLFDWTLYSQSLSKFHKLDLKVWLYRTHEVNWTQTSSYYSYRFLLWTRQHLVRVGHSYRLKHNHTLLVHEILHFWNHPQSQMVNALVQMDILKLYEMQVI